jgi:hypothetical protein
MRNIVTSAVADVLEEEDINIRVVPLNTRAGPRETRAAETLNRLCHEHGQGHLRTVLSLLVQSRHMHYELVAPNMHATSRLLLAHPEWNEISKWFDVYDEVPIGLYRRAVSQNRGVCKVSDAMATVLFLHLARAFGHPSPQLDLFGAAE